MLEAVKEFKTEKEKGKENDDHDHVSRHGPGCQKQLQVTKKQEEKAKDEDISDDNAWNGE